MLSRVRDRDRALTLELNSNRGVGSEIYPLGVVMLEPRDDLGDG